MCLSAYSAAKQPSIYRKGWIDFNKNGRMDVYENPLASVDERVNDLLSRMTMDEKTCQMVTLYGSGRVLKDAGPTPQWRQELWKDGIANIDEQANGLGTFGSEISFPYAVSVDNRHAVQRWFVEETRLGIPVDFTNEGIRGLCHDRATMFPAQCGQGCTWDRNLIDEIARVTAEEAIALGYTNIYAPLLDISQDPRWGRVVECYGEDPYLVGELGKRMVLGGNEKTVREEYSRTSLDLCGRQQQLLSAVCATGKPVVLVMVDGRAASINWAQRHVPGIIHAWFPGEFMGDAIAWVLFGDYNPGGKLAVTFPKSVGQIPFAFPFKPGNDSPGFVRAARALYPFGYGLSYTTFEYSNLSIATPVIGIQGNVTLTCRVRNTGKREGDEVVQLYLRDDVSSVTTYEKVLRGFERIHLQPGEERLLTFTLTPQDLGLWNRDNRFTVEPGTFTVMVGASSEDIRLRGTFEVK